MPLVAVLKIIELFVSLKEIRVFTSQMTSTNMKHEQSWYALSIGGTDGEHFFQPKRGIR